MLTIEIYPEEITVLMEDGTEVVHWTEDEWLEDPAIVPAIVNAIHLAHTAPDDLIALNQKHIDSQREISVKERLDAVEKTKGIWKDIPDE